MCLFVCVCLSVCVCGGGGEGGWGLLGLIFAGYVPLAPQNPYPITPLSVYASTL